MLYHLSSSLCTICTAWLKYGFNQLMDPLIIRNILDGIIPYKSTNNHREASLGVCSQPPIIGDTRDTPIVLLVKIEGPAWYTIYHQTCCSRGLFKPLYSSTKQWEKDTYRGYLGYINQPTIILWSYILNQGCLPVPMKILPCRRGGLQLYPPTIQPQNSASEKCFNIDS